MNGQTDWNALADIFNETREISNREFKLETKRLVEYDTSVYQGDLKYYTVVTPNPTPLKMVHGGTIETGYKLIDTGKTAILNFADAITVGGSVLVGGTAQEENICRCTNLYESIVSDYCDENYYKPNAQNAKVTNHIYTNNVIYSRDVVVFRDDKDYHFVSPKYLDVITCPAPSAYMDDVDALKVYTLRIEQIVLSAKINNARNLVLGAWGCGAFMQKPELIARAFATVLNEYGDLFDQIVFAIRSTPDADEEGGTFTTFFNTLTDYYRGEVING